MTRASAAFAILLSYALLTIWIEARWAWGLAQCAVFIWLAGWAVQQIQRPSHGQGSIWLAPLCAAPAWAVVQLAVDRTVYRWGTWSAALTWTTWAALFFLALQIFDMPATRQWFLRFVVYFGFGLSVLATLQMFSGEGKFFWLFPSGYTNFVMGPFVNRNQYAAFVEMILPVALWQALRDSRRATSYWMMAAAMAASVVASASRAGTVMIGVEVIAVLCACWWRRLAPSATLIRGLAIFGAVLLAFAMIVSWQPLRQRFNDDRDPFAGRREYVLSTLDMVRDRPAMGFGLGNWARVYPKYALFEDGSFVNQAHNDWLQWTAEGGVPFLVILLSLVALAAPAAIRSVWGIGLLSVWIHGLVDYPLQQRPGVGAWFFVLLGVLAAAARRKAQKLDYSFNSTMVAPAPPSC